MLRSQVLGRLLNFREHVGSVVENIVHLRLLPLSQRLLALHRRDDHGISIHIRAIPLPRYRSAGHEFSLPREPGSLKSQGMLHVHPPPTHVHVLALFPRSHTPLDHRLVKDHLFLLVVLPTPVL